MFISTLRWLCSAGFAAYTRLKSGHTIWRIFDKPQTETAYSPTIPPQVEIPQVAFEPVLIRTETEEINKQQPAITEPEQKSIVVVDGLIFPEKLNPDQKKSVKHIIKKIQQPELQQPVLFALAYAMATQKINSVPAYLQGLVKRANNGTFEPIQAAGATKPDNLHIDKTQERLKAYSEIKPSSPEVRQGGLSGLRSALKGMVK